MQQELNDTKSLLLKYQIDLQSSLDCKVKNIKNVFSFRRIDKSDKDVNFSTCLNNTKVFLWILKRLEKHIIITHKTFSLPYHVLVVLMKIKLALLCQDIDDRFNVNAANMKKFLSCYCQMFEEFLAWPDRGTVTWTLPKCFEKKFRDCICIIDCSEVFIERPKNLIARAQTWSNYKHSNTIKYLVGLLQLVWSVFFRLDGVETNQTSG